MSNNEIVFSEASSLILETYTDMRRRSADDVKAAIDELQTYLPSLIAEGEFDRERLAVKGLTHLRKLEHHRPRVRRAKLPATRVDA